MTHCCVDDVAAAAKVVAVPASSSNSRGQLGGKNEHTMEAADLEQVLRPGTPCIASRAKGVIPVQGNM